MEVNRIKQIVEAALMAADEPLGVDRLVRLFKRGEMPVEELREAVKKSLEALAADCEGRGFELCRVASGYRFQVRQELAEWVSRLWEEKPGRYSRAFLETLSLIAYKQPVTRGDIELVRGVAVSPNIIRTLLERGWIRIVGTRDVPGKPSLYGTTREFLDYFNLNNLEQLPPLAEVRSLLEHDAPDDPLLLEGGISVELVLPDGERNAALADADAGRVEAPAEEGSDQARSAKGGDEVLSVNGGEEGDVPHPVGNNVVRLPTGAA